MAEIYVRSRKNPGTIPVRDDGAPAVPATNEAEALHALEAAIAELRLAIRNDSPTADACRKAVLDCAATPLGTGGTPEREAWPEGVVVHIKDQVNSGDTAMAKKLLASRSIKLGEDISEGGAEMAWYLGALTSCAVMIVKVDGILDPDTNKPLDFSGGVYERLAEAQMLPNPVIEYVGQEIDKLSELPFGPKKSETPSAIESGHGSTRTSKPRSAKVGARA